MTKESEPTGEHDLYAGKTPAEVFTMLWEGDYANELIKVNPWKPKQIRKFSERYADMIKEGKLALPESDPNLVRLDQLVDELNSELASKKSAEEQVPHLRELLRQAFALVAPENVEGYLKYFELRVSWALGS